MSCFTCLILLSGCLSPEDLSYDMIVEIIQYTITRADARMPMGLTFYYRCGSVSRTLLQQAIVQAVPEGVATLSLVPVLAIEDAHTLLTVSVMRYWFWNVIGCGNLWLTGAWYWLDLFIDMLQCKNMYMSPMVMLLMKTTHFWWDILWSIFRNHITCICNCIVWRMYNHKADYICQIRCSLVVVINHGGTAQVIEMLWKMGKIT